MPRYRYTAKTAQGKTVHGVAEAPTVDALYAQLRTEDKFLTAEKEESAAAAKGQALKTVQVAEFCRSLGTLLSAGVPLVRALNIISEEEGLNPAAKKIYESMRAELRKGIPLSDAMENQAPAFPSLLVGMMRSAEGTGNIDKTAMRMALHYEKEHKLNQQISSTMMYPAFLGVMIVGVLIILLTFVVPQFEEMFAQMETLPLPTVLLLGMSEFLKTHWLLVLLGVVGFVILLRVLYALPPVRLQMDRIQLHIPIIGNLQRKIYTARFARTLSNLYSSGVPIMASLISARSTIGNTWIEQQFDEVLTSVRSGHSLSDSLKNVDGFERKLSSSIMVGEETGKLDDMMATMSETMDYEAEMATKKMMTLLEPVMIVLMAGIVAFVIVAVLLPIYQSYGTIGGSAAAI